jgi:glycosylphosphatidylinositol transamidase
MNIRTTLQEMWNHDNRYKDRLCTMLRGMVNQALGHASGPHSSFIPYHIDAITLQAYGDGWHDEVTLGRAVESLFRSLNNLLEHFHQSFFFYLLMAERRFVSIGTYLPSAMLIAVNFTIAAIGLWLKSGRLNDKVEGQSTDGKVSEEKRLLKSAGEAPSSTEQLDAVSEERPLLLSMAFVVAIHFLGFIPLYLFNNLNEKNSAGAFYIFTLLNVVLPPVLCAIFTKSFAPTSLHFTLIKCFSLLLLGMFLSALATLNFSLSFLIGVFASPITFISPTPRRKWTIGAAWMTLLQGLTPTTALVGVALYWGEPLSEILKEAAFGWRVWGMWTQVVVWCVWWPAWIIAGVLVAGSWAVEG